MNLKECEALNLSSCSIVRERIWMRVVNAAPSSRI